MKMGQIREIDTHERKSDSFEREKQLRIIERERRGKIMVIFAYPPKSVFQIPTVDLFTVGLG